MSEKHNIGWIDVLRIAACFMVVFAHCCDPFVAQFDNNREMFLTGVFAGSLTRPCVPLFVMMTAVLLLPIKNEESAASFYKKRIGRIAIPLVFWSIALPVLTYIYFAHINPETQNMQLSADAYTAASLTDKLYTFIFNFNFDTTPLWYLYMLIGLYIIMPIVGSWLQQATKKDIRTVLYIWGATLFMPYISMVAPMLGYTGNYGNMGLLGVCDWNVYGTFYYISGFVGYVILAYYLNRYPLEWSWQKIATVCTPLFLLGYAITSIGYIITNNYFPGNYAYLEILWYFTGINVFMMTFPIFVIFRKLSIKPSKRLSQMASLTFGIYLCHFVFTFISYDIFDTAALPYLLRIILATATTFTVSACLVWVMSKNKATKILIK